MRSVLITSHQQQNICNTLSEQRHFSKTFVFVFFLLIYQLGGLNVSRDRNTGLVELSCVKNNSWTDVMERIWSFFNMKHHLDSDNKSNSNNGSYFFSVFRYQMNDGPVPGQGSPSPPPPMQLFSMLPVTWRHCRWMAVIDWERKDRLYHLI